MTDLGARDTEGRYVLTLSDIQFRTGEAKFTADTIRKLYPLMTLLEEKAKQDIVIEGYTDSRSARNYNQKLSEQRALAVRDFFISTSVNPQHIIAHGYGEVAPITSNVTAAGRQENRGVKIIVPRTRVQVSGGER